MKKINKCFKCGNKHMVDAETLLIETEVHDDGEVWYNYSTRCPKCEHENFFEGITIRDYIPKDNDIIISIWKNET